MIFKFIFNFCPRFGIGIVIFFNGLSQNRSQKEVSEELGDPTEQYDEMKEKVRPSFRHRNFSSKIIFVEKNRLGRRRFFRLKGFSSKSIFNKKFRYPHFAHSDGINSREGVGRIQRFEEQDQSAERLAQHSRLSKRLEDDAEFSAVDRILEHESRHQRIHHRRRLQLCKAKVTFLPAF